MTTMQPWLVKQYEERAAAEQASGTVYFDDVVTDTLNITTATGEEYLFHEHEREEFLKATPAELSEATYILAQVSNW